MDRQTEMRHFFMIMSAIGTAKAAGDIDTVSGLIDDLEMMAMHAAPVFAKRAEHEAAMARAWHDDMAMGLPITVTRVDNVAAFVAPALSH